MDQRFQQNSIKQSKILEINYKCHLIIFYGNDFTLFVLSSDIDHGFIIRR